jgi:hypothetical protein
MIARPFFLVLLPFSFPEAGHAQTLMECSASAGKAFYFTIDQRTGKQIGWVDDGISNGTIALVMNGEAFDIIQKDAVGIMSATAEGATVVVLDVHDPFVDVLVSYPQGAKELYTFDRVGKRVTWSQHKFGVLYEKASTFIAECQ